MQGVKINDKHFEIIVHQMMRKVLIQMPEIRDSWKIKWLTKSEFMEETMRSTEESGTGSR